MTIQKAKEIIEAYLGYMKSQLENLVIPATPEGWLVTDEAQALLSGEDWISVETKLPEIGAEVIGFFPDKTEGGKYVATAIRSGDKLHSAFPNSTAAWFEATHWMPLPEPPKP